jgi:hypothetical protein
MMILYVVPIVLVLGIGAVMVFLWALQSGGPGQQRRKRLEAAKQQLRQRTVEQGPAEMPGLSVETAKPKAAAAAAPQQQRKRVGGGTAAE